MSVAIDGKPEEIPGLVTKSFLDPGGPKHCAHFYSKAKSPRNVQPINLVGIHTVHGNRGCAVALDEAGKPLVCATETIDRYARYYSKPTSREASASLWVGGTGLVLCTVDLGNERSWHGVGNPRSVGIEMEQRADGTVYEATYAAAVTLISWLCQRFSIPRIVPMRNGKPIVGVVKNRATFRGVLGHRNVTTNRGPGDPGDVIFERLHAAGFDGVDPDA